MGVQVTVTAAKEAHELAVGVCAFVEDVAKMAQDGFQVSDLPALLTSVTTKVVPALQGAQGVKAEWQADKAAVVVAVMIPVVALAAKLVK